MLLLLLSLAALFAGPALVTALGRRSEALVGLDALVVVALCGLVLLHIVPDSLEAAGWPALAALSLGSLVPGLAHGAQPRCGRREPGLLLVLAVLALGVHALLDGVALVPLAGALPGGAASPLAVGIVLHRLVEGVGVWWLVGASTGPAARLAALGAIAAATCAGFGAGSWAQAMGMARGMALVQAGVAGSLMHVLMRHAPPAPVAARSAARARLASAAGGLLGLGLLVGLHHAEAAGAAPAAEAHGHVHAHAHAHMHGPSAAGLAAAADPESTLAWLAADAAPAIVVALLVVALAHALGLPGPARAGRTPLRAALRGALSGLLLTPCACGTLAVSRRQLPAHIPPAQAAAHLLAAPGLGLVALVMSTLLLGPVLTLVRVAGAVALAVGAGLWAARGATSAPQAEDGPARAAGHVRARGCGQQRHGPLGRLLDGAAFALGEVLAFVGPWQIFALLGAMLALQAVDPSWLTALGGQGIAVPLAALAAAPLSFCAAASTLLGGVLRSRGLPVGAALALMWSASLLSPATLGWLRRWRGRARARQVACGQVLGIVGMGLVTNAYLEPLLPEVEPLWRPLPAEAGAAWAAALWVLLAWSVARQGVRPALDQIASPNRDGAVSHHHGAHDHAHAPGGGGH